MVENSRLAGGRGSSDPEQDRAPDALEHSERSSGYEPESGKRGAIRTPYGSPHSSVAVSIGQSAPLPSGVTDADGDGAAG